MGYNKVVLSGDTLEIYQYEKNLSLYRREKRSTKGRVTNQMLASSGEDVLFQRQLGKRRDNARRAKVAFARLVRANLGGDDRPILITLTYAQNQTDIRSAYGDFTSFIQALRFRFGKGFKYIATPEFQKRGAVHFHALVWGLPKTLVLREREDRVIAGLWARGFVSVDNTDGNEKLSYYLAKYMVKAYTDSRLIGQKAYIASRNVSRPVQYLDISPLWPLLEQFELSPSKLLRESEYMTQWLGKGRYKSYKLNS